MKREYRFVKMDCPIAIGRGEDNMIVLPDKRVSNHHARIEYKDGFIFHDLDSSNGSFLKRGSGRPERIIVEKLESGDMLHIGLSGYVLKVAVSSEDLVIDLVLTPSYLERAYIRNDR